MSKKYNISSSQFAEIKEKYGRLIYTIAHKIGGDSVVSSVEDSVQDIYCSALDACEAYGRKCGESFDEFFDTIDFDKYIKSAMWNKKNNQGALITKKYSVNNHMTINDEILERDEVMYELSDASSLRFDVEFDDTEEELLKHILNDHKLIKPNGNLNYSKASRLMGVDKRELIPMMRKLQSKLKDYEENA